MIHRISVFTENWIRRMSPAGLGLVVSPRGRVS